MRTEKNEVMERNETVQMMRNGTMEREMSENMADYDGRPCVAAMDLGTNSNRLLIADTAGNAVYRDVKHVALGEGLAEAANSAGGRRNAPSVRLWILRRC